jgi:hypothetical protein
MAAQGSEGFVRQRRNLMLSSLILLFSEVTELTVEKLTLFGTELLIGKPQAVTMALWIATLYWALRYYQYSRAEYRGVLRQTVREHIHRICGPTALTQFLRENSELLAPDEGTDIRPRVSISQYYVVGAHPKSLEVGLELDRTVSKQDSTHHQRLVDRRVELRGFNLMKLRIRGLTHSILHTTVFTELMLPYVVFCLPILYASYQGLILLAQ